MKKTDKDDLALTIACMMGAANSPNDYAGSISETARIYKDLTGKSDFDEFIKKEPTIWQKIKRFITNIWLTSHE